MGKIKILIVDNSEITIDGLKTVLGKHEQISIEGEANNAEEALELVENGQFDVVLMDIDYGKIKMDGVTATRRIREMENPPWVIAVTNYDDRAHINAMVEAGATGYVLKDSRKHNIIEAILKVAEGGRGFAPEVAEILLEPKMKQQQAFPAAVQEDLPLELFTRRETDVLREYYCQGKTARECAELFFISIDGVQTHVYNIRKKTGWEKRIEGQLYAQRMGLCDPEGLDSAE